MNTRNTCSRQCVSLAVSMALLVVVGVVGHAHGAVIVTSDTTPSQGINLTDEGSADWVQLGIVSNTVQNEKVGANYISAVTRVNAVVAGWNPDYNMTWTDGTPVLNGTDVDKSWEAKPAASGNPSFDFDVTGPPGAYQMIVYATLYSGDGQFTASVSGGGPSDSVAVLGAGGAGNRVSYTVDFDLAAGQHLDVTYELTAHNNSNDNVGISGITLSYIPEPATMGLLALGALAGLVRRGRRA